MKPLSAVRFSPRRQICTLSILLGLFLLPFAPSTAKDGDVIARSSCTGSAKSKLKASPENGRIEVEYELDNLRPGDRWRVIIRSGRKVILRKTRRVTGTREINFRTIIPNQSGTEKISAKSRNLSGAGRCNVSLRFRG
jgi:hypothetical protein